MRSVTLGETGLQISPVTLGTWELSGLWGPVDEEASIAAIRRAHELGVNSFDTAQAYGFGDSERLLGRALRDALDHHRDEIVVATKGGLRLDEKGLPFADSDPAWLWEGIDSSLRALDVDYVDLYQVHSPDTSRPFAEVGETLAKMVEMGKVRHVGVSNFDGSQMEAFSAACPVETLQSRYNIFERAIEAEDLPYAQSHGIGVLGYAPLAHGILSDNMGAEPTFDDSDWRKWAPPFRGDLYEKRHGATRRLEKFASDRFGVTVAQLAVAWTLAHPALQTTIVGTRNARHVDDAVAAAELELTDDDLRTIDQLVDQ